MLPETSVPGVFAAGDVRADSVNASVAPYLDEKLLRLSAGALALAFGEGSASAVAAVTGLSGSTVGVGMRDLAEESAPVQRIRRPGAGRPAGDRADVPGDVGCAGR